MIVTMLVWKSAKTTAEKKMSIEVLYWILAILCLFIALVAAHFCFEAYDAYTWKKATKAAKEFMSRMGKTNNK